MLNACSLESIVREPAGIGRRLYSRKYILLLAVTLIAATAAAHGSSLWAGLFFDDHLHYANLNNMGWSYSELLDATTIKPDAFMHTWWQETQIQWRYTRPFSVLLAKSVFELFGRSVLALHALSILLHLANAFMVHHLCLKLTRRRFWSVVGALLFVVYSHSVYAVSWLAAQNVVLQTTLMLAALLCYLRASGLNLCPYPPSPSRDPTPDSGRSSPGPPFLPG